jgi:enolase
MDAIKKAGYEKEVKIGMDVAASEFLLSSGMQIFLEVTVPIESQSQNQLTSTIVHPNKREN